MDPKQAEALKNRSKSEPQTNEEHMRAGAIGTAKPPQKVKTRDGKEVEIPSVDITDDDWMRDGRAVEDSDTPDE